MRILGTGKTGLAIKEVYQDSSLFDDTNKSEYNFDSDEVTVVSPGIPPSNELVKNTKNLISEYDLFYNDMPFTIWISGTNGKTTTTQMLQHLLEENDSQCGGNIGFPIADMDKSKKIWILETSSFTLHYTNRAKPNIYILLPIHADHLSWHGTFEEYENSKLKPLSLMTKDDIAIIPSKYKNYKTQSITYFYDNTSDIEKIFNISSKKINFKEPFLMDAVLSLAISSTIQKNINYQKINTFIQDPHKLEEFKDVKERLWVDDSKATNIDATIQALKTYGTRKIHLILGGDDKGVDLKPLFEMMQSFDISLYLIGKNEDRLYELSKNYDINAIKSTLLKNAVDSIDVKLTDENSSIALLSPAAASFDQFASYKDRGDQFKEFVYSLKI